MGVYLLRRLLLFIPTLLVATTLVFFIFRLVPGDPAQLIAGELAPQEVVESIRHQMGLDQPIHVQYLLYLDRLAHGDLGISKVYQQRAMDQLLVRLPATLLLALAAMLLASIAGVTAGVLSAVRRYSWIDYACMLLAVGGVSMPGFWLGLMLIVVFSVALGLLPVGGFTSAAGLVLPAVTLAANQMAVIARMTRSTMLDVLNQDYVRTARAKGLNERLVLLRHTLRNALIPTTTIAGLQLGYLLGGSLVVETVFSWPGVGRLMIDSIQMRDYTMVQAVALVYAALMLVVNLLVDLIYAALDPRVRYA
ncbi:MAG TPA: ABC transporter permease [Chloroflexota bacterium]|nr:ABC transporter permease [Chloroflexota bacterium]